MGGDPGTQGAIAVVRNDGTLAFVRGFKPEMGELEFADVMRQGIDVLLREGGWECY